MSDDPVPITVLGAGPIGLETALYARFLGHPVSVIERGDRVGANLRQWGHVRMFSPFGMNASALGVAATGAHDPQWKCPAADELLSGAEFCQRYLAPLAETDLLADCFTFGSQVIAIGRSQMLKGEGVGDPRRGEDVFRLLLRHLDGNESTAEAEVVIDCTGTYANHNWLGQGGVPAIGERSAEQQIEYGLPDMLVTERDAYADRHVLVVGSGYSAATSVVELAKLADEHPSTRVTWLTRQSRAACSSGPIRRIESDRLPERDCLAAAANQLANDPAGPVRHLSVTGIHSIEWDQSTGQFEVTWSAENEVSGTVLEHRERFDRVVANIGYRPDNRIYAELQVHECYASGGPMKLAAQLLARSNKNGTIDCLDQTSCGPESLLNPEPNFYILGSKSYGRGSQFLLTTGLEQIRDLFTIISGRKDLNLYATMPQLTA
jgi:thioredoxin reductase